MMTAQTTDITTEEANNILRDSPMMTLKEMNADNSTPAMAQYLEIKCEHRDYLLFYRMGDFYELFFEDAITVSGALGLTLTSRSKVNNKEIPMCGVPFHAYEIYLSRLIKMGYKVAICEQMETPEEAKKRGAKSVRRDVVRLVTAGTLTEDSMLDAKSNNYLVSFYVNNKDIGLAWLDISTGDFFMQHLYAEKQPPTVLLSNTLARLSPSELIFSDRHLSTHEYYTLFGEYKDALTPMPQSSFNLTSATNTILKTYQIKALDAFGDFSKTEIIAAGVLLNYVANTQKEHFPHLEIPLHITGDDLMEIDHATRQSLEILQSTGREDNSLRKIIDRTVTGNGGRLLSLRLASPSLNVREINNRLDAVNFFVDNPNVRYELRKVLRKCTDIERSLQRLSAERGGPKDLYDIASTLKLIPDIQNIICAFASYQTDSVYAQPPLPLFNLARDFFDHTALQYSIETMLEPNREDLPKLARMGGFIRKGAYDPLDYLRDIKENSVARTEELRIKYTEETEVQGLKIKNNSVIGYFVEVPIKFADKLLGNPKFIHRQSVLNAVRFTTAELSELEDEVNNSIEKALEMELKLYEELVDHTLAQGLEIRKTADALAKLDVAAALAELATEFNYVRPVVDESLDFEIIEGRHPVVESVMRKDGSGSFVANSCTLNAENDLIWLLTGPNMAGKSTFLRQNALIAIMAQIGSYVPAKSAKIGIINKLFSRVGASDDLARGRSTFMVEMVETAAILNRADKRSFVILDEIGRGTATFDGLSIAWAVVEHLAEVNKCRTVFATHYHELTTLNKRIKKLSLHCMKTKEFNNDVIFMHEVISGSADRSYGIHVAKLAGLPELSLKRAEQVLALLEEEKHSKITSSIEDDLPLFQSLKEQVTATAPKNPILEELKIIDIDNLSPREALDKLYELKNKAIEL